MQLRLYIILNTELRVLLQSSTLYCADLGSITFARVRSVLFDGCVVDKCGLVELVSLVGNHPTAITFSTLQLITLGWLWFFLASGVRVAGVECLLMDEACDGNAANQ